MTLDRRGFLAGRSRAGITSALLPGILYTLAAFGHVYQLEMEFHKLHSKMESGGRYGTAFGKHSGTPPPGG